MSALQPRIADRIAGRNVFCLNSSINFFILMPLKDVVLSSEFES